MLSVLRRYSYEDSCVHGFFSEQLSNICAQVGPDELGHDQGIKVKVSEASAIGKRERERERERDRRRQTHETDKDGQRLTEEWD